MIADPYLATKDIEVRKHLCAEHMRTHLTPKDLSYKTYYKISPAWCGRAIATFTSWEIAKNEAFSQDVLKKWKSNHPNANKYTDEEIEHLFIREYLKIKNMTNEHFSFDLYMRYRDKTSPPRQTFQSRYGSLKSFYLRVVRNHPEIKFDLIAPYTEEELKMSLIKAIKEYGVIRQQTLIPENGFIHYQVYTKRYGSLEAACKKFGIAYDKNHNRRSKLYQTVAYMLDKMLPLDFVEEKQWPWLKNTFLLSIDRYYPFFNLAIEVDGEQHYKKTSIYHKNEKDFITSKQNDKIKDIELPKHNITLIRIKYNEVKKIPDKIKYYVELLKTIQEYCAY